MYSGWPANPLQAVQKLSQRDQLCTRGIYPSTADTPSGQGREEARPATRAATIPSSWLSSRERARKPRQSPFAMARAQACSTGIRTPSRGHWGSFTMRALKSR